MKRTELFHNNRRESLRKLESIRCKRFEILGVEGLLRTYEELPDEKRDYDYERHLRAKLRAKRNQLQAMCPL